MPNNNMDAGYNVGYYDPNMKTKPPTFDVILFTLGILALAVVVAEITGASHKTIGAQSSKHELSCYQCETLVDGDKCNNLSLANRTAFIRKCEGEQTTCMVKRYSYTLSTENLTGVMRLWSLQRNCTARCEPGCIIIGERTKLYACTSCCENNACNDGSGNAHLVIPSTILVISIGIFILKILNENI